MLVFDILQRLCEKVMFIGNSLSPVNDVTRISDQSLARVNDALIAPMINVWYHVNITRGIDKEI